MQRDSRGVAQEDAPGEEQQLELELNEKFTIEKQELDVYDKEAGEGGGEEAHYDYEDNALDYQGEGDDPGDNDNDYDGMGTSEGYTGHSNLYASSFLTGGLLSSSEQISPRDGHDGKDAARRVLGLRLGSVSTGEVQLQTLQQELETEGVVVEYKLGLAGSGGMLVCGGQVC